jgi:hypothetical protein
VTPSTTNTAAQSCLYPQCNCPFDAPADPNWCARGLPRNTLTQQQGGEQEARELLALECGFDPDSCGKFEGAVVSEAGALRAIAAALQAGTP